MWYFGGDCVLRLVIQTVMTRPDRGDTTQRNAAPVPT